MKKLLIISLLAIVAFVSCDKDNDEVIYRYTISNKTDKDITAIVLYSFQEEFTSKNKDKEYAIPLIKTNGASAIYETKYPYVMMFVSNDDSDYVTQYPSNTTFYKLDLDKVNIIELK